MNRITFDPCIPLALWVPLALAAAGLLAWYAAAGCRRLQAGRWWTVVALMAAGAAAPLIVLLNPTWQQQVPPPPGRPLLTILVDRSASMATRDADAGTGSAGSTGTASGTPANRHSERSEESGLGRQSTRILRSAQNDDLLGAQSLASGTRQTRGTLTRYQAAAQFARAVGAELGGRYEVRVRAFADVSAPIAADDLLKHEPDGAATDLATAIEDGLEDDRPQGQAMLLLSDGIHNAGGVQRLREAVEKAKATATPVYTKTIGGPAVANDIEVNLEQPQELAFVDQRVPVTVSIRQRGFLGPKTTLRLLLDDRPVEKRDVALKADGAVEEVFYLSHKKSGLYRYDICADGLPGEVTTANNRAPLLLRVVDQPVRVLLLEGKPYWDTKFLVRTLSADRSIELTSVVLMAEGRLLQRKIPRQAPAGKPDFPSAPAATTTANRDDRRPALRAPAPGGPKPAEGETPREEWTIAKDAGRFLADAAALGGYQIVILGRNAEVFLTDDGLATLRKWLAEGEGSLVCFRGPPASQIGQRLGELMPVRWTPAAESRFHVALTGAGEALKWLGTAADGSDRLAELPSLALSAKPDARKALTVVLAKGAGGGTDQAMPVLAYQPVGSGRVVVVEGAGMWRWAFLAPEQEKQEEVYGSLWRSLVRWLVANVGLLPSQRMSLRADKLTFNAGENVTATLLVRDWSGEPPQVQLVGPGDRPDVHARENGTVPLAERGTRPVAVPPGRRDLLLGKPRTFTCVPHGDYPGQYYAGLGRLPEGRYSLSVLGAGKGELSAVAAFDVRENLAERLDLRAQPDVMRLIAQSSGGAVLETVESQVLAQHFDRHLSRSRPERTAQTTAWDRWWVLLGALTLWGAAWGLRRNWGLV